MFRDITAEDHPLIALDVAADPYHNQQPGFTQDVFADPQNKNVAFADENGEVVFWASFSREIRVRIQFREGASRDKVREAFKTYVPMFGLSFKQAGARAFLFDTKNKVLAFFLRRFGFRKTADEYRMGF